MQLCWLPLRSWSITNPSPSIREDGIISGLPTGTSQASTLLELTTSVSAANFFSSQNLQSLGSSTSPVFAPSPPRLSLPPSPPQSSIPQNSPSTARVALCYSYSACRGQLGTPLFHSNNSANFFPPTFIGRINSLLRYLFLLPIGKGVFVTSTPSSLFPSSPAIECEVTVATYSKIANAATSTTTTATSSPTSTTTTTAATSSSANATTHHHCRCCLLRESHSPYRQGQIRFPGSAWGCVTHRAEISLTNDEVFFL